MCVCYSSLQKYAGPNWIPNGSRDKNYDLLFQWRSNSPPTYKIKTYDLLLLSKKKSSDEKHILIYFELGNTDWDLVKVVMNYSYYSIAINNIV